MARRRSKARCASSSRAPIASPRSSPEDLTIGAHSTVVLPIALETLPEIAEGGFALTFWFGDVPATAPIRVLDVEVPADLSIAVVAAPGDSIGRALDDMGVRPVRLLDEELATGDLSLWNAIVLPARAYYHRPVLRQANARLLKFVEEGGTLVVGACRPEEWQPEFAPVPFALREARVTRPDAPVTFPTPEHRLLHFPNEVRVEDFGGFRLDRGAFFPELVDPTAYEQPIRTADPGGPREPGVLLRAWGKGLYAYVPLSWHRHLDDLNPASLKLLGNLVSYRWRR